MRLAFAIFRYFPFGGLQRDMLSIVQEAISRGHRVTVFCGDWQGEKPRGVDVVVVSASKTWDIAGVRNFVHGFQHAYQKNNFDVLVGFNKMPELDFYFAGDSCFAQKVYEQRNFFYRFAPRSRLYLQYENAVFSEQSKTKILSITDIERRQFARYYSTPPERFFALPPGIDRNQFTCADIVQARAKGRAELHIESGATVVLCLGSGFKTKGLDRSIAAFALLVNDLPAGSILLVVGADNSKPYIRQAEQLNISACIKFVGGRSDVATILQTADVLLHPAYRELAGNVILEAMLAGKPVVTTDVCGYAHYVTDFDMGFVVSAPYDINTIVLALRRVLQEPGEKWKIQSEQFLTTVDAFSRQACVVDILEDSISLNSVLENSNRDIRPAIEWRTNTPDETIILRDEMILLWSKPGLFNYVQHLSGTVARELPDRQTLRFEENGNGYYRKLHRGVGWREIFKNLLQLRLPILGAKNEWVALNKLRALNIPSLEPIAFGEQKASPATKKSFIVTRELTNVVQLDDYFRQVKVGFREKAILLREVAEIASAVHMAGINHRDFYLCHFMLDVSSLEHRQTTKLDPKVFIVDLHRAQIRRQIPFRWLVKDLSGLYFSSLDLGFTRNDYFRFMCAYWKLPLRILLRQHNRLLKSVASRAVKTYKRDFGKPPVLPI